MRSSLGAALILLLIYAPGGLAALGWHQRKPAAKSAAAAKLEPVKAQP